MTITAEPVSPSGLLSVAEWAAINVDAAPETSVTAMAVVGLHHSHRHCPQQQQQQSSTQWHDVNGCLHNGHDNVIADDRPSWLSFLSNNNKGNVFLIRHAPSNA
jgi:hypothetical protein